MYNDKLDDGNFILYAAKYYDNPECFDTIEFYEDLKRFKYIKRLINKYKEDGVIKERLILNHIIALNNLFGPHATVRMLFFRLQGYEKYIKPFLVLLNIMPERVVNIGIDSKTIISSDIPMDPHIINILRNI